MCRNIKTLFNFEPPASDDEVRAASLQFVRKLSGFTRPSRANEAVFERAVDDGFVSHLLLSSEPLQGDNVWRAMTPGEIIGADWRMQLYREAVEA